MRVCIPSAGAGGLTDLVGEHFGRVPTYTLVDTDTGSVDVVPNTSEHAGGSGLPANILSGMGIDVLLCQGAGRRALSILSDCGIHVCVGVSGRVGDAVEQWKKGNLTSADAGDACQRHEFHDHNE